MSGSSSRLDADELSGLSGFSTEANKLGIHVKVGVGVGVGVTSLARLSART